ncbi:MAG: hypothetical protein ACI88G_001292 [Woeseiaceae bacterium]|jgi:hypothetical protein
MSQIYIIHENDAWTDPLRDELASLAIPYEAWFIHRGQIDLDELPPNGVFYNRMSASSHTRNHRYAAEYASGVLAWLESHGRLVINSSRALQLEVSKIAQYVALNADGIRTPKTIAAIGRDEIIEAAGKFSGPFITKHNRGGKGLGVRLFYSVDALQEYVSSSEFELPVDGITLVQEYIEAPKPYITRVEFVGGRFLYAVRVDTSEGFELCPADVCQVDDGAPSPVHPKFSIIEDFRHPIIDRYERFLRANNIHIAGIEFIVGRNGELFTYDINTNTNYNPDAEKEVGISGMGAIARYLGEELACLEDTDSGITLTATPGRQN